MAQRNTVDIQLAANMLEINAALDGRHKTKFLILCKRRRDLQAKLPRPEVASVG